MASLDLTNCNGTTYIFRRVSFAITSPLLFLTSTSLTGREEGWVSVCKISPGWTNSRIVIGWSSISFISWQFLIPKRVWHLHSSPKRTSHWQSSALLELNHCWTKSELTNPITAIIWGSTSGKATLSLMRMTTISRNDKMKDFKWRESLCWSLTLDKFWYFLSLVPSVITDILTKTP